MLRIVGHAPRISHVTGIFTQLWGWIGLSSVLRPRQHSIGYMGGGLNFGGHYNMSPPKQTLGDATPLSLMDCRPCVSLSCRGLSCKRNYESDQHPPLSCNDICVGHKARASRQMLLLLPLCQAVVQFTRVNRVNRVSTVLRTDSKN